MISGVDTDPPMVDNDGGATDIGVGTASLRGTITAGLNNKAIVYWGPGTATRTRRHGRIGDERGLRDQSFTNTVSGALYGITNYYRCYATNAYGEDWADWTTNFMTLKPASGISLDNAAASPVEATSAQLNGTLSCSGSVYTVYGYWNTTSGGTDPAAWTNSVLVGSFTNLTTATAISGAATGLTQGTTYYFAFRGVNIDDEIWSAPTTFTTSSGPGVDNAAGATGITAFQATLNGTLTNGSQAYVTIYWGDSNGETDAAAWGHTNNLDQLSEGPFSSLALGLTDGVTYYYRCYATNEAGEAWAAATSSFVAQDTAGPGQTWDGGGGANDDWTLGANWVGDVMPGRPATSVVTFNNTDVDNTNRLDTDWTLNGGMTVANTTGAHTIDLGGNTLTLNGGTLTVSSGTSPGNAHVFTNGTLKIGDTSAANVTIGSGNPNYGTMTVNSAFSANLNTVTIAYGSWTAAGSGVLDLRGSTPLQSTLLPRP